MFPHVALLAERQSASGSFPVTLSEVLFSDNGEKVVIPGND